MPASRPRRGSPALLLLTTLVALVSSSCQPFAAAGESCEETPCALGLVCVELVCEEPVAADAGPPACASDDDCDLQGNADGRACVDGACAWATCSFDAECGTRVCDQGECAVREACASDDDCDEGDVCDDDACRSPCDDDEQCTGLFEACAGDGRCKQRCFIDLLCFGGLCVDGVCADPECSADEDCEQDGDWFCNAGRCQSFLPCDDDGDCFDANFRCNELGRCEERAACVRDDECGLEGLCIDAHCRDTVTCLGDDSVCDDDEECVAGRCTSEPGCRANADCAAGEVCARGACRQEAVTSAAAIVVETPLGSCAQDGSGACELVLFAGEQTELRFGAFDDDGAPVLADLSASADNGAVFSLSSLTRHGATLTATQPIDTLLYVTDGALEHAALLVTVLPAAAPGGLRVLVVEERTGVPVGGAEVTAAGVSATTNAFGLATFAVAPSSEPALVTAREGDVGVAVADIVPSGDLRLTLPLGADSELPEEAAGFTARVISSGDETGPVGLGLALPSVTRLSDASASSLLGPAYVGTLEVPLLGALPVALPAAATLQATLPIVGQTSDVRPLAYARTSAGPRSVTAFEGRYETDALFAFTGAGDEVELLLDLAAGAEGMDALWAHVGTLTSAPLVGDEDDVDGDGDVSELVPDFDIFPSVEVTPSSRAAERLGVVLGPPPASARARVLAVAGLLPPGYGFVPSGLSAFVLDDGAPRQLKVVAPAEDGLTAARRALMVQALFDDGSESRLQLITDAFGPALDLGSFLDPPAGAAFLDGVPLPGDRLLLLPEAPGATTYRVLLEGAGARWQLYLPAGEGGRSLTVDDVLGGSSASLQGVEVLRFDDDASGADPTHARFRAGAGPAAPACDAARAHAVAP